MSVVVARAAREDALVDVGAALQDPAFRDAGYGRRLLAKSERLNTLF